MPIYSDEIYTTLLASPIHCRQCGAAAGERCTLTDHEQHTVRQPAVWQTSAGYVHIDRHTDFVIWYHAQTKAE